MSVEPARHSSLTASWLLSWNVGHLQLSWRLSWNVELAQRTLILTCIFIFVVELAVEVECRASSTDIDRSICIIIFTVELTIELECPAGSKDFDFDMCMHFCCRAGR